MPLLISLLCFIAKRKFDSSITKKKVYIYVTISLFSFEKIQTKITPFAHKYFIAIRCVYIFFIATIAQKKYTKNKTKKCDERIHCSGTRSISAAEKKRNVNIFFFRSVIFFFLSFFEVLESSNCWTKDVYLGNHLKLAVSLFAVFDNFYFQILIFLLSFNFCCWLLFDVTERFNGYRRFLRKSLIFPAIWID